MSHGMNMGDRFGAKARRGAGENARLGVDGYWTITCRDKDGNVKWTDEIHNIITNAGLDNALKGGIQAFRVRVIH